ncbi:MULTISPECIES: hypothetical protein [unclassified Collinsella]|uniref:hypothetical protein n=1 Tax=unclassified Collinsella TaxID=2637548 RepID=UPI0011CC2799|nr:MULTISPECIES: hypothetical protein [unclassified Collinsella]TXF36198.1 hypothetical protein E4J93_05270 [Collinsella sp. BA40]
MSTMQKLLKITSLVMLALGGLFIPFTVMNFINADTLAGILIAVLTALMTLFDLLLGFLGSTAANVPSRVTGILPIVVIALIVNAASVFYIMFMQGLWMPVVANAVVGVVFSFAAHKVNKQVML